MAPRHEGTKSLRHQDSRTPRHQGTEVPWQQDTKTMRCQGIQGSKPSRQHEDKIHPFTREKKNGMARIKSGTALISFPRLKRYWFVQFRRKYKGQKRKKATNERNDKLA